MEKLNLVKAYAPATVANVSCGFDIMGFAIDAIGDCVTVEKTTSPINEVILQGTYAHLIPSALHKNTASVAIQAYLNATQQQDVSLKITLEKNMPLGSGMGSSAASAAAAVFALNHLLGNPFPVSVLIPFAMEGERVASGSAHADNVAPSLLGGFVLIRSYHPLDIIEVKSPEELYCAVVHPHIELHTSDARRILQHDIPLGDVIKQTANTAGFMAGLLLNDYALLGRSMQDLLAEPKRTMLIPGFDMAKQQALLHGALGCGISGSGPSIFALTKGEDLAIKVSSAIQDSFLQAGLTSECYVSALNAQGARIINAY